jgi:hypothetical protein
MGVSGHCICAITCGLGLDLRSLQPGLKKLVADQWRLIIRGRLMNMEDAVGK